MITSIENIRKVFILGDLHIGVRNNSKEWVEIQRNFLINHFVKLVDEEGFDPDRDILIQLGDWHHVRESMNVRVFHESLMIAETLCKKFKRGVFEIVGNHDVYYKDRTDVNSMTILDKTIDNFHVYEKTTVLNVNGQKFLMLPWIESVSEIKDEVLTHDDCDYIFCHADVKTFALNRRMKLEHGLERKDLENFKHVFMGHIHIRQNKGNATYAGTPYELDRGDRGNTKGFYVLNLEDDSIKFIKNLFSPVHVKYEALDILELTLTEAKEKFNNNFVDIMIDSELASKFPYADFAELIDNSKHRRLDFLPKPNSKSALESDVDLNQSYEYNIFNILDEKINAMKISSDAAGKIKGKFTQVYDSISADSAE